MASTFAYSPQVGESTLASWSAGGAPVASGGDAQQAMIAALAHSETMAAARGFAQPITIGNETGVIIGGARDRASQLAKQGDEGAIIYLAQYGAVRRALANTIPVSSATPTTAVVPVALPLVPILITVAVVGVAASIAAAYWAHEDRVKTEATAAKQVASTDAITKLAATGRPIDPAVLAALSDVAKAETSAPLISTTGVLLVGGALALALLWDARRGEQ